MDEDERYIIVSGRRWRREDPGLPDDVAAELRSHLGAARSAIGRASTPQEAARWRTRVSAAKHGLGERGTPWWEQGEAERRDRWQEALRVLGED